jgi:predicted nucleic acid-binding Zn ribbon protein
MAQVVVCDKCGATFRNRVFWAFPSSGDIPRKHCPRCATKGPFREATCADIVAFSEQINKNFTIFGIIELVGIVLVVISIAFGFFK